jgi:hypothetical protein
LHTGFSTVPGIPSSTEGWDAWVLDGSRMTEAGWKLSYHVIYPWLVFPCNSTILMGEAELLSARPEFQYRDKANVLKPFVDPTVYRDAVA